MAESATVDSRTDAALKSLADIVLPPPVSMMPATWGWAVLAALIVLGILVLSLMWLRRWRANRYRREALAQLEALEERLANIADIAGFEQGIAEILKRTALAAWPRADVASLSGAVWGQFLERHGPVTAKQSSLMHLVNEQEYEARDSAAVRESRADLLQAARRWIEAHHVSA